VSAVCCWALVIATQRRELSTLQSCNDDDKSDGITLRKTSLNDADSPSSRIAPAYVSALVAQLLI